MFRKFLCAVVPCALASASIAVGASPASVQAPGDDFETDGALDLVLAFTQAPTAATATLVVEVEDCGTFTYTSTTAGSVTRTSGTSSWALDMDLASCRGESAVIRTHHCDGYGSTFETCEADGEAGADRAMKLTYSLKNRAGVDLCRDDLDGDGKAECDIAYGTLLSDDVVTEIYVPGRYWTEDAYGWVCASRAEGGGVRDPLGQGGTSCVDLGL